MPTNLSQCYGCGKTIPLYREGSLFCSTTCEDAQHRAEQAPPAQDAPPPSREPEV